MRTEQEEWELFVHGQVEWSEVELIGTNQDRFVKVIVAACTELKSDMSEVMRCKVGYGVFAELQTCLTFGHNINRFGTIVQNGQIDCTVAGQKVTVVACSRERWLEVWCRTTETVRDRRDRIEERHLYRRVIRCLACGHQKETTEEELEQP
jgi:hypothetical protein